MPGGTWAQQLQNTGAGGYGYQAPRPASPFDNANLLLNGGGQQYDAANFGRGANAVQKRQFANVGKVDVNLLDPLSQSRAATNYQPIDGQDGGLLGIGNYYNARQPGGLFAGLLGAVGQTVGGIFGEGGAKTGSDIGTVLGKTVEMPMALVGSAGVPFVAPVIDNLNSEIEKFTPYILRDTLKIPTNVGGAFQSMLNIFGLAGMGVERTYAGMGNRGELPADLQARIGTTDEKGHVFTHDDALDELVLSNRGYSNDGVHNLVWNLLLDPANWVSLGVGAVGGAVRGTGTIARTFGAAVRADEALATKLIGQGGRIGEMAQAAQEFKPLTGMVDSRGTLAQMRNILDDTTAPFQLKMVERLGMSALGPVGEDTGNMVAKVGHYILRATDPVNFFSGSKAGQRSMGFLTTAASTAAIAAYKPLVVRRLANMADSILDGSSETIYRAIGINGANAMQEHVLSDLATDAMQKGAIPRTEKLSAAEAARSLLRGGAYDSNIGKYIEVQIERNKDISVGMLPPEKMYDESANKFAALLGVDVGRVKSAMKSVSSDDAILIHAMYYYFKGEALHTGVLQALKTAKAAGQLAADLDPERVAIISAKTLTNRTVASLDAVMKTGNVGAIRQEVEKYNDFNWVNGKNIPDSELKDDVQLWLDTNRANLVQEVDLIDPATGLVRPGIPKELSDWAQDGESFGYKLGQKMPGDVPEDAAWRVTRDADGNLLHVNPYSDFWVEGGDSAKKVGILGAVNMAMTRGIRTERIMWSQRRKFITDMAKAGDEPGGVAIPPALGDRIWKALMFEAKDRFIQPRGMEPKEMYIAAKRVLDDARKNNSAYDNLATKLTERQVVLTLLRATEGEVALVGVTQKATGAIKAFAPGSGANYWGRISERLYPLMRFTLNPVFQTMEAVEPYVLNSMRGIWVPLKRNDPKYQNALGTRNAISQLIHLSGDPDGIAAETAEALATQAYTGSQAAEQFGRGRISRWMPHIGERKDVAAAMETERIMGDHMYEAFKAILNKDGNDRFEAFWGDMERNFGTTNRGKLAKMWMAANFALQDVNGFQVASIDDLLKMKTIGKRMRLNKGGDKGAYTFADVETVFDHVRSYDSSWTQGLRRERLRPDGSAYAPGEALLEDLKGMSREDWWEQVNRSGLNNEDGVERISQKSADDIWKMANGPELDEFWNGQYTVGGVRTQGYRKTFLEGVTGSSAPWTRMARDQEVAAARSFVQGWAIAKGMTEEEYVKLHFEDIPQHFATVHDLNVPVSALLPEVREEWAQHALGVREMNAVPTRGIFLQEALNSGAPETHPAYAHLETTDTATDSGYLLMKVQDSYLDDLTDAIGSGSQYYRGDMPNRGYIDGDRLVKDLRYGDVVVRVPKGLTDDLGDVEEGIRLVDKNTIDPRSMEYLTNDGWVTMHKGKPGKIAPPERPPRATNTEVETGQTVYTLNKTEPSSLEAGVTKLDIESVHHTFDERNAVEFYTGSGYVEINGWLRGTGVGYYPHLNDVERKEIINHLDRAVAKGQTREPTTLYRGINMSQSKQRGEKLTIDYENLWPAGKGPAGSEATFRDPAFFSTSTADTKAREFAGFVDPDYDDVDSHLGVVLTIDAPAGTHLHQVEGYESEFLWGRGVEFRVTKRRMSSSANHGNTLHLTVEPISDPVKPGVKRLWLGEQPQALRNEGRFLQDAVQNPEALRAQMHLPHNDSLTPEQATKMQADIETAIAKAEAAKPAGREVIGGVTYGERTVGEALDEIKGVLDSDEITIAAGSMGDLRTRAEKLMESELWSYDTSDPRFGVRNQNNLRLLSAFAVGIAEEGGARFGMRKALQAMEMLYTKGPAAIMDPAADEATRVMGTHLVRGALYGIEQPILTNKLNDAHDAIWGNTSRRATGRIDAVQPVLADDLAAEVAGYMTPSAFDEHVARGDIQPAGAPAAVPTGTLEPTGAYLGGTTGPVQMRDPETGALYVDKRGASPDHVREEHYTNDVYEAVGVPVPHQTLLDVGGTPVQRAQMIEGGVRLDRWLETASPEEAAAVEKQLQRGFALDALLANWDVVGLEGDNILVKDGVPYRIDNGGSLRFRAQGGLKGDQFGTSVSELNRMRTGNEWQRRVFGTITQGQVRRQVLELGYVLDDIKAALPPELRDTIQARYDDMLRQTEGITPDPSTGRLGAVKPELPTRPAPLGEYEHEHVVKFYNDMAKAANEQGFNGRSTWTADEMRSVASMSRQFQGREGGKAASALELRRQMTDVRMAVGPGEGMEEFTPLFDILNQKRYRAEKQRVMAASSTYLYKALRDQLGIAIERGDPSGVGLFDGETASGLFSVSMLGTPERMDTAADVLAYVTGQPRVTGWRLGPAVGEIKDPAGYTPRASIYIPPSDITPRMAEKVAEAIGKAWPEAGDLTAVRGANGSWHLQLIDSTGDLFPRVEKTGFVDEERLMDHISDILTAPGGAGDIADIERADLQMAMEYGHLTDALPTHGPDGRVDWYAYADDIEARSKASGAPISASALRAIRSSYQLEVKDALRREAPKQYDRVVADIPISGRNLEDRRGGDILGVTSPGAAANAAIRGFNNADPLTGLHELVHVFSVSGADPSMREAISKAFDEYQIGNDAAKQAKLAILQQKAAAATTPGRKARYQSDIVALTHDLQTPHPTEWGNDHEEFFVHLVMDWIERGVPQNPDMANAFNHFRNWIAVTKKSLAKPGMIPLQTSDQMDAMLNRMFSRPGVDTVSYSVEQQTLRMAGQQVLRSAWDEAHATQFYKRDRSMAERSINHPYIGLYPASYMWGKILPEMLRFLALRPFGMETPFLAWNVAREVSDSVRAQAELDPGFKDWLDGNKDAFMLFSMLFPGLPHDIPANASLPVRRIAEQGLEAQKAYATGTPYEDVKDIDYGKGAQDAIQYALGPLGTIRTATEVVGMGGNLVRSTLGSAQEVFAGQQPSENIPLR